jgi:hypothetical protein
MFSDCNCSSPYTHAQRESAYLCGPYDLSDDDSEFLGPLPSSHLPNSREGADEITRRIRENRHALGVDDIPKRTTRARQLAFPKPIFVRSPFWHLSEAQTQVNGLLSKPGNIAPVPQVPAGVSPEQHLLYLQKEGYKIVKQHR